MSQTARQRAKRKIRSPVPPPEEKVPSRRRRFLVQIGVEIEVDERLLASVLTAEWRQNFYRLTTPGDVAGHLAYNLIQDRRLSSLDGFAEQPGLATASFFGAVIAKKWLQGAQLQPMGIR